jgi:hypothetical protein
MVTNDPRRRLAAALAAGALAALALAAPAAAEDTLVAFQTPSHGIGCMYLRTEGKPSLRCDIRDMLNHVARPASCELDYGSAFGLGPAGRAQRLCVGDTVLDPKAKVLAYGGQRTLGPFTCTSRRTGLRCATHAGHGFVLARGKQSLF